MVDTYIYIYIYKTSLSGHSLAAIGMFYINKDGVVYVTCNKFKFTVAASPPERLFSDLPKGTQRTRVSITRDIFLLYTSVCIEKEGAKKKRKEKNEGAAAAAAAETRESHGGR